MKNSKILLALLPYWSPLIPPLGIGYLKSYLEKHGYVIKGLDFNIDRTILEIYNNYFKVIKKYVPGDKWGNLNNIGHEVLRNHMMVYINAGAKEDYRYMIREIVYQTYFHELSDPQSAELEQIIAEFFKYLNDYFCEQVEKTKPGVVGLTVYKDTLPASIYIYKLIKKRYPDIKTVMGGSIFSDFLVRNSPDFDLFLEKTPEIDMIAIGEGQELFLRYLQGDLPSSERVFSLKDMNKSPISFPPEIPDLTDFPLDYYQYLGAVGSISCPNRCSFCNVISYSGKYRKQDVSKTADDMIKMHGKYGFQTFFMTDSLLNPIIDGLAAECIARDVSIYWDGYLRVEKKASDPEKTFFWRRGGFYRARLGIESGSQKVLDLMEKRITPDMSKKVITALAEVGIKTTVYLVIGHPGETDEDFKQTLDFIEELKENIYEVECNPFYHFFDGQGKSAEWKNHSTPLYSGKVRDAVMVQTWIVDGKPSRPEIYKRLSRVTRFCEQLGVPNPYSLHDIYKADERWKRIHKNAVPSLFEFRKKNKPVLENKNIKRILKADSLSLYEDETFNFQ